MLFKFGTRCRSGGTNVGNLWGLSIEPAERILLRAVVEEPQSEPLVRIQVPFGRVDNSDADVVSLGMSPDEFKQLPPLDQPGRGSRRRSGRRRRGEEPMFRTLTTGTRVACRDGQVGTLDAVSVDSRTGDLTDLSFDIGVTTTREIVVAFEHVEEIGEEEIVLRLNRDDLQEFPSRR